MTDPHHALTQRGQARRAAMRADLINAVATTRHTRRRRRTAVSGLALMLVVGVAWAVAPRLNPSTHPSAPVVVDAGVEPREAIDPRPARVIVITRHGTESGTLARYASGATTSSRLIQRTDDATFIAALDAIERPAGLIVVDGRAQLTRNVTDAADDQPPTEDSSSLTFPLSPSSSRGA